MKRFRKVIFWAHLCVGVVAGIIIAILCLTGAVLAFEEEWIAAAEKDSITLELDASRERKEIDVLVRDTRKAEPELKFSQIIIPADAATAWRLNVGRRDFRYLNPYTGELWQSEAQGLRDFFFFNFELHRWLVLQGESRDTGRMITNVANLGFLFLCLSGLYLWCPRVWRWKAVRAVLLLKPGAKGKARDFNWHNVFGFWALIPLILMILTGSYFYYDWAKDGAKLLFGPSAPRAGTQLHAATKDGPVSHGQVLSMEARFQAARAWSATWEEIRMPIPSEGQGKFGQAGRGGPENGGNGARRAPSSDPAVVLVKEQGQWFPYNRPSEIRVDLYTAEIAAERRPSDLSFREKLHSSLRYIHTGQAGLLPGKVVAFLGCVAGLILVYSGFALSLRRLMNSRRKK